MRLIFKDPNMTIATPCVSEITDASIRFIDEECHAVFYGFYGGCTAVFLLPASREQAAAKIQRLFNDGSLYCYNYFTSIRKVSPLDCSTQDPIANEIIFRRV